MTFSMLSPVQAGVGFTLMPGRMKKVYENSVQLLKLAEPYQMQQLIAIVFARNREQDRACAHWPPKGGCMREASRQIPRPRKLGAFPCSRGSLKLNATRY